MVVLKNILKQQFGHPDFREGQLEIVEHIAEGRDALVVMPTGAGKSLCFQLPALARGGTTIVVSPLIALMKDQVDALKAIGVKAALLNSSLSATEYRETTHAVASGEVQLLYVAPERFSPGFLKSLRSVDIRLLAIDEAHCLSQWGHDFRPDYLRLGEVRKALGSPPTAALTATATPEVQTDIIKTLGLEGAKKFVTGFDRDNLILEVAAVDGRRQKDAMLAELVARTPAIVYCATRKNVDRATAALQGVGVKATAYHAGLTNDQRKSAQDQFMSGQVPVVVATNAFGMGIDKADIRSIVHYDMPGTVEAYYQEIGRAGRDGRNSRAILLYHRSDRRIQQFFIDNSHPPATWVHMFYDWLKRQGQNPLFATLEEMSEALPSDAGNRAAGVVLTILRREGLVRRISPSDRPATLTLAVALNSTNPSGLRGKVWQRLQEMEMSIGHSVSFTPRDWASQLAITREQLHGAVIGLQARGLIRFQAADHVGGVEMVDPDLPLELDEAEMVARRNREYQKLDKMEAYTTTMCRRRYIIEYFGESAKFDECGTCDACRSGGGETQGSRSLTPDEETVVLKVLSCLARMSMATGQTGFSVDLVAKTLMGSTEEKIRRFGFDRLSTHGILGVKGGSKRFSIGELADLVAALVEAGALNESYTTRTISGKQRTYKEVSLSKKGDSLMRGEVKEFEMVFPHASKLKHASPKRGSKMSGSVDDGLLNLLRDVRAQMADQADVPAYVVATNKTLEQMAELLPTNRRELLKVHGMGPKRAARFGGPFLAAIQVYGEGRPR